MSQHDESDIPNPLHLTEPTTIRLYGIKDITLPAYLLWFLATILAVAVLIVTANEIVSPDTSLGHQLHRQAMTAPWTLKLAEWVPLVLGLGMAFELIEGVVVLTAFAKKAREQRADTQQDGTSEN